MTDIKIPDFLPANSAEAYRCGWVARDAVAQADASVDAILAQPALPVINPTTRDLIERMAGELDACCRIDITINRLATHPLATEARAYLAAEPQGEGVSNLQWPRWWSRRQRRQHAERLCRNSGITGRTAEMARLIADAENGLPLQDVHDLIASYALPLPTSGEGQP